MFFVRNVWRADRARYRQIAGAAAGQLFAARREAEELAARIRAAGVAVAVRAGSLRDGLDVDHA